MSNNAPTNAELVAWLRSLSSNQLRNMNFRVNGTPRTKKFGKREAENFLTNMYLGKNRRQYVISKKKGLNAVTVNLGRNRERKPPNVYKPGNVGTREVVEPPVVPKRKAGLGGIAKSALALGFVAAPQVVIPATAAIWGGKKLATAGAKAVGRRVAPNVAPVVEAAIGSYSQGPQAAAEAAWNTIPLNKKNLVVNIATNKFKYISGYNNRAGYVKNLANATKQTVRNKNINRYKQNLKNKGLLILANYFAEQIGYKNKVNTDRIDAIIKELMSLKEAVSNTKSTQNKYTYGYKMGKLLGELITSYTKLPAGSGKYRNVRNGAIAGVLEHVFSKNISNTVRRIILVASDPEKQHLIGQNVERLTTFGTPAVKAGMKAWAGNLPGAAKEVFLPSSQNKQLYVAFNQGPNAAAARYIENELSGVAGAYLSNVAKKAAKKIFMEYMASRAPLPGETPERFRNKMKKLAINAASQVTEPVVRNIGGPLLRAQLAATNRYYNIKSRLGY